MKTLNIYLVRHGKVDAPLGLHGQTDVKVTPADQESIARAWAESARGVGGIISSPLSRCQELANIIAEQQLLPVMTDESLQEMAFGDHNDGMAFFRHDGKNILAVNNEYTN